MLKNESIKYTSKVINIYNIIFIFFNIFSRPPKHTEFNGYIFTATHAVKIMVIIIIWFKYRHTYMARYRKGFVAGYTGAQTKVSQLPFVKSTHLNKMQLA